MFHVPAGACNRLIVSQAHPGAQPLADHGQSLEAAGVAGALLQVKVST